MKRKLLMTAALLSVLALFSGCKDYSKIDSSLENVKIENKLPKIGNEKYRTLEEVEDAVYDQQLAACEMLSDTYRQTNPQNMVEKYNSGDKRLSERCNNKRNEINKDIQSLYTKNVYALMEDVKDCPNVDAYVTKTYSNVLTFYDEYAHYNEGNDKIKALTDILVYYYDRTNVLAKSFLARNERDVFEASVEVIEENAKAEDSFRFYINKNNIIIKALNEIYGGVPNDYAERINEAGNILARNLLNSLESLSDKERANLMDELGLSTPTPSPKPTPTPAEEHTPIPAPSARPLPTTTPRPAATPMPTARPAVTAVPAQRPATNTQPVVTPEPEREPENEPENNQEPEATEEPLLEFHFD